MLRRRLIGLYCGAFVAALFSVVNRPACAITIVPDYSYDTSDFFGAGNPTGQGVAAKAAIEAVAGFYSTILIDTFSAISKPADLVSANFNGVAFWDWTLSFPNPSTGSTVTLQNQSIAPDIYRLYVGARNIAGSTLGVGGPGGNSWSSNNNGGGFSPAEGNQLDQTTTSFSDAVTNRGETSGFAAWGGAVTFDRDGSTVWHYNHNAVPTAGTNDFFSVAIHEVGHALGLGASPQWSNLAAGSTFTGAAAAASYGSQPPLEFPNPTRAHWASGTMSVVLGTNTPQEAAMDPEILQGTRKQLTALDAAALTDIGWSVAAQSFNSADFNHDGTVNGPDLAIWRSSFGTSAAASADGDGDTDGNDFLLWQRRLGLVGASESAGLAVPEPAGMTLAAWFALFAATGLRRVQRSRVGRAANPAGNA